MVKKALLVRLEAKPGKEAEVESFLRGGLPIVQEEPTTTAWFAIRLGPSTFGIFDAFPDEAGRQAHLSGRVAAALMAKASELLAKPPLSRRSMFWQPSCPGDKPRKTDMRARRCINLPQRAVRCVIGSGRKKIFPYYTGT
jgi:quinol monooxygenase YgiN